MNAQHFMAAVISSTPPPKHIRARDSSGKAMTTEQLAKMPKGLDLDRLMAECEDIGADPHKVIAYALTEMARMDAKENGMTLKAQSDLAWKVVDKANPSQQAVKVGGDGEPIYVLNYSPDDQKL